MQTQFDVIILGAGIVGLVAANLCAQQNLTVALVDPKLPTLTWSPEKFDIRCFAITQSSQKIMEEIGIWEDICRYRLSSYDRMEIWDACSSGEIHFDALELGEANLGYVLESSLLVKLLWEKLREKENIACFVPARAIAFVKEREQVVLQLNENVTEGIDKCIAEGVDENIDGSIVLTAKLLVGADGAKSWLREAANIKTRGWDYQQNALVATVETGKAHQATARQCFLKDAVLAFLPLKDTHFSSIVWSVSKAKSDLLLTLDKKEFAEELAYTFDYRLGKIVNVGERCIFPLAMQHTVNYIEERIALIGDAAHVIHPLAGQGINLGIYDAKVLAECLGKGKQQGYDIGQKLWLRRYERARKGQNLAMAGGMEFFKRIFSLESSTLQGLRGLGVNFVNASKFLKKRLVRQAMGMDL